MHKNHGFFCSQSSKTSVLAKYEGDENITP